MKLRKTLPTNASLIGTCLLILTVPFLISSCLTEPPPRLSGNLNLPQVPYFYGNADVNQATLGRVLFYDKNLSANNSVSCSSCHKQSLAFADNVAFSRGFENGLTRRNSMPIQNLSSFSGAPLFWDGREFDLAHMVTRPIVDPVEMGFSDMSEVSRKLQEMNDYKILFSVAFGDDKVTPERIGIALAAFVQSFEAMPFIDTTFSHLTGEAKEGAALFFTKYECNGCHRIQEAHGYLQAGTGGFSNIGLDPEYDDNGQGEVTRQAFDNGKFKIPSLRNVALTAPYMHDGRFLTLEEAIDHYSEGIQDHPNLDVRLRDENGAPKVFAITEPEKKALVAFLKELTTHDMIGDVRFSDPFIH